MEKIRNSVMKTIAGCLLVSIVSSSAAYAIEKSIKKIILQYATHWTDEHQQNGLYRDGIKQTKGLLDYISEYEMLHPEIDIEHVIISYGDYESKLKLLHNVGSPPDIFQIYSSWGVSMAEQGILSIVPDDLVADVKTNFMTTAGVTINNKIWGIPTEINDYALLCNKDMFKAAGLVDEKGNIQYPRTWPELVDAAVKMTKRDAKGNITQCGFSFFKGMDFGVVDPFLSLLYTNNGKFISDDHTACLVNSPEGVEALEAMVQLFDKGASDIDFNMWDFGKGTVAMIMAAPWTESVFRQGFKDRFDDAVGVVPIPYLKKKASSQYSWFMGVMKGSPHKKEAWDFLRWFAVEIQTETGRTRYGTLLADTIGAIPARKVDLENSASLNNRFKKTYVNELPYSIPEPNVMEYAAIKEVLRGAIEVAWTGNITPQAALNRASLEINEILAVYYKKQ